MFCDRIGERIKGEMSKPIAHIADDGRKHDLYNHLVGMAKKASEFAAEFGCGEWGAK